MPEEIEKAYQFAPLAKFSLKDQVLIRAADLAFFALVRIIGKTIRYEVEGWENFEAIGKAGKLPIYSFWHNRIFSGTYFFRNRGIVVITSQSKDGEYIARFIQRLGFGAVRGSSTRGGVGALVEMIRLMRGGLAMAFSVDGPKGPRYVAKTGAVLLAKKTGNPMMPFVVENKNYWTVKSWDRLQIPKPFTRAKVIIGKPVYVSPDADIENSLAELQQSLDRLVAAGEEWRIL
ncbi:MAG: lysophospholipid acyltransferase family protein [Pyrinomonadaceae bacterium]